VRRLLAYALGFGLIAYFIFFAVAGERGFLVLRDLEVRKSEAESRLAELTGHRAVLENRVSRLRASSLDPDMLEERARVVLAYTAPAERILYFDPK
jgi:cell division protein FtsB